MHEWPDKVRWDKQHVKSPHSNRALDLPRCLLTLKGHTISRSLCRIKRWHIRCVGSVYLRSTIPASHQDVNDSSGTGPEPVMSVTTDALHYVPTPLIGLVGSNGWASPLGLMRWDVFAPTRLQVHNIMCDRYYHV